MILLGHGLKAAQRIVEIGQRFVVGPAALRLFRGHNGVIDSLLSLITASEMKGEKFGHLVAAFVIEVFEGVAYSAVMRPAVAFEKAPIGCLLRQRMAKDVENPVADKALIDEFQTIELAEQAFEPSPRRSIPRSASAAKIPGR